MESNDNNGEERYSNREEDQRHKLIMDRLDELIAHVKITNGNVLHLQKWQSFIMGGVSVLAVIVVPVLLYILYTLISQ